MPLLNSYDNILDVNVDGFEEFVFDKVGEPTQNMFLSQIRTYVEANISTSNYYEQAGDPGAVPLGSIWYIGGI